jgi:hypothetical protein
MGFFTDLASFFIGEAGTATAAATSGILGKAGEFGLAESLQAAGVVAQVGGEIVSTLAQKESLERQAALGLKAAEFETARLREEEERLKGRQRVAAAKSGVRRTGSVLETMQQSAEQAELEALNIQFGAQAGAQARLFEAKQTGIAGGLRAGGTFLTGFGGGR